VRIYPDGKNMKWSRIRTEDGFIGYIENKYLNVSEKDKNKFQNISKIEAIKTIENLKDQKIVLAWDISYNKSNDLIEREKINTLDIISPTWFQVKNEKGDLISRAYKEYMEWAKENGYMVWALFSNDFNSQTMTSNFLNNSKAREKIINDLLKKYLEYGIDGINIDFEMIQKKDSDVLVQFIKELAPVFKNNGIVTSIDVHVPNGYDNAYTSDSYKELINSVDYIIMMGYDQFWSGSKVAGSVAEIGWVENNLKQLLDYNVPSNKIILGIPFYTRLWEEKKLKNGTISVSGNTALSMKKAKSLLEQNNVKITWDNKSGQFFGNYSSNNSVFKIWLEDENSIELRTSLVHKYDLAGIAAWRIGFENQSSWDTIYHNLKVIKNYEEWQKITKINYKN
jgi:spore germination protein YaaH